jgi:hypothetical protein
MQSATLPAAGTAPVVEPVPGVRALELDAALTTSLRCYRAVTRASLTLPPVSVSRSSSCAGSTSSSASASPSSSTSRSRTTP